MNSHVLFLYVEVGRCWKMTLIWYAGDWLSDDVILAQRKHSGIVHWSLMISIWICTQFVPLMFCWSMNKFWIIFFKQLCLKVITVWNYEVRQNVRSVYENCQHSRFALSNGKNDQGGTLGNVHTICLHKITSYKMSCNVQWPVVGVR